MTQNSKLKLVKFFQGIAQVQRKIEMLKQVMSELPAFTPASIFHRLDSERKGYLGIRDIRDFLEESQIKYTNLQLKTLFGRIDQNLNGKLNIREFQDFILPCQNSKLRYEVMRRQVYISRPKEKLSHKIEWTLARFFTEIFSEFQTLKKLNNELKSSHDFNFKKLYDLVKGEGNTIDYKALERFLQESKSKLGPEQIGCIVKQIDDSGHGQISLDGFRSYVATMRLARQHQLFDDMRSGPAVKLKQQQQTGDRELALYQRFLENELYRDLNILRHDSEDELFSYRINMDLHSKISSGKKPFQRASSGKKH